MKRRMDSRGAIQVAILSLTAVGALFGLDRLFAISQTESTLDANRPVLAGSQESADATVIPFWHLALTEMTSVTTWMGPAVVNRDGRSVRYRVMNSAVPESQRPWSWMQSAVLLDSIDPIGISSDEYSVSIRPSDGETWGSVVMPKQLDVTLTGLLDQE